MIGLALSQSFRAIGSCGPMNLGLSLLADVLAHALGERVLGGGWHVLCLLGLYLGGGRLRTARSAEVPDLHGQCAVLGLCRVQVQPFAVLVVGEGHRLEALSRDRPRGFDAKHRGCEQAQALGRHLDRANQAAAEG
jgi:hypothetical protein